MILIPYEQFTIETSLLADEARDRLVQVTEPNRLFRWWWTEHKAYEGNIQGYQFSVSRIINYRNSFLPSIAGQIQPARSGCSIRITMRLHIVVLAFIALWLAGGGLLLFLFLGSLIASGFKGSGDLSFTPEGILIAAAIFVLVYGIVLLAFRFEAAKSKAFFYQLFQAREAGQVGKVNFFRRS